MDMPKHLTIMNQGIAREENPAPRGILGVHQGVRQAVKRGLDQTSVRNTAAADARTFNWSLPPFRLEFGIFSLELPSRECELMVRVHLKSDSPRMALIFHFFLRIL